MSAIHSERLHSFAELSQQPLVNGRTIPVGTLQHWRLYGVRGVKLETLKAGGKRLTSVEALHRFWERLEPVEATSAVAPESKRARERRYEIEMAHLEKMMGRKLRA